MKAHCLYLEPLRADQYKQVAEWEYGPQPENTDWEQHAREMSDPKQARFGIYLGLDFVGCLSLEKLSDRAASFHVAVARRRVHPRSLARALLLTAEYLFLHGFRTCEAHIPAANRAACRLALRCGLTETGRAEASGGGCRIPIAARDEFRHFTLTKEDFFNAKFKT